MKRHILTFLITLLVAALFACSYENTATVTIDTGIRQQAQLSLFDRVLAFFSFAQPLQADPPQNVSFDVLELSITAADMTPIILRYTIEELYNNYGKITVEVPSGSQRVFTIVAGNSEGQEIYNRIYGGVRTLDLSPGQQVNLNIEIGQLFDPTNYDGNITYYYLNSELYLSAYTNTNPGVFAFKLYRKQVGSNFSEIYYATINNFNLNISEYLIEYTISINLDYQNYDYYISAVNNYGEGNRNFIELYNP